MAVVPGALPIAPEGGRARSGAIELPGATTEERLIDATLRCIARFGVAKTTLDDVAREAGCARATLYRYFGGKRPLLRAAVEAEGVRVGDAIARAGLDAPELEDAVVAMMLTAAHEVVAHDALQHLLAHEPEVVLPYVSFEGADRFLAAASHVFVPVLAAHLPADRVERAAEWCTRVLLAQLCPVGSRISMTDETSVRDLVRQFVLPGLLFDPSTVTRTVTPRG